MADRTRKKQTGAASGGRSTVLTLTYLLFGPIVWALHFFAIYGPQSLLCARGLPDAVPPVIALTTLASVVPLAGAIAAPGALARLLRADGWAAPGQRFLGTVMRLLAGLSLFGVVAAGAAQLILPSCGGLR